MARYQEEYATSFSAGVINAAASETFNAAQTDLVKLDRYGSANSLILTSLADELFRVDLDGTTQRTIGILGIRGSLVIKPEDGIYFNSVKLTNLSATNSSADEVKVRVARSKYVGA